MDEDSEQIQAAVADLAWAWMTDQVSDRDVAVRLVKLISEPAMRAAAARAGTKPVPWDRPQEPAL